MWKDLNVIEAPVSKSDANPIFTIHVDLNYCQSWGVERKCPKYGWIIVEKFHSENLTALYS